MGEREQGKEIIGKGDLYFLCHSAEDIFSGYGLAMEQGRKDWLVGLLMVDRPKPADPDWLREVENTFGKYSLIQMTETGDRGIACQMHIDPENQMHLRPLSFNKTVSIKTALQPLLEEPPNPIFTLRWNEEQRLWQSRIVHPNELPIEICEVFENFGYGCLATESNIGVVHVCHAADDDIDSFENKPVISQWQLIKMPTAPLIRLVLVIQDRPNNPYQFESFLNIGEKDQARILTRLANQEQLYLAFYGDKLNYRFTKIVNQDNHQWQQMDELAEEAMAHLSRIRPEQRDFDLAKNEFMKRYV